MGVGGLEFFMVPVSSVYEWDPAELCLATHVQCWSWVSVKGPHEECGFRLTPAFKVVAVCTRRKG
jgi:hypothetical protein